MSACEPWSRPAVVLTRLRLKKSARGDQYLVGRLGNARLFVVKNPDRKSKHDASHLLMLAEITEPSDRGGAAR